MQLQLSEKVFPSIETSTLEELYNQAEKSGKCPSHLCLLLEKKTIYIQKNICNVNA